MTTAVMSVVAQVWCSSPASQSTKVPASMSCGGPELGLDLPAPRQDGEDLAPSRGVPPEGAPGGDVRDVHHRGPQGSGELVEGHSGAVGLFIGTGGNGATRMRGACCAPTAALSRLWTSS